MAADRRRPLGVLALTLVVALAAACAPGGPTDGPGAIDAGATPQGPPSAGEQQLDCEREGYPCSWAEVDPAAVERTDELLALATLMLESEATADEIAGRLRSATGVAEVIHDRITVAFRVEGAVPVFVYVDPTDGGLIEGAVPAPDPDARRAPVPAQDATGAQFRGCPDSTDERSDGEKGPVGRTSEPKKALILGPWKWQMRWDVDTLVELLKFGNSDYALPGGGVTTVMTTGDRPSAFLDVSGEAVRLEDFCGWEQYDTIILKTHGRTVCSDEGTCFTGLSVGRFHESAHALRRYAGFATGVTFSTSRYGNLLSGGPDDPKALDAAGRAECIRRLEVNEPGAADDCLERLVPAGHMEVTTDFFVANYGGGLRDRMIFISACQGMKQEGGLAGALRGSGESTGAILGFDRIIQTSVANEVLEKFAEWVGTGTAIDRNALRRLNQIADDAGASADVAGQILGTFTAEEMADVVPDGSETTRGADIVSLHDGHGGPELVDGGSVRVDGRPGDGKPDKLELGARLTGVGDEGLEAYEIEIWLDDRRLGLEDYRWRRVEIDGKLRDAMFDTVVVADVGRDLAADELISLEIRVELPDAGGAISRWRYEDLSVGSWATITIGGRSWKFVLFGIFGEACERRVPDDGRYLLTTGYVNGDTSSTSFTAHLEPEGRDVEGRSSVHFVTVTDPASGLSWMADDLEFPMLMSMAAIPDGASQIDEVTITDDGAFGTATFIELGAVYDAWDSGGPLPAPEPGTFEIRCGS